MTTAACVLAAQSAYVDRTWPDPKWEGAFVKRGNWASVVDCIAVVCECAGGWGAGAGMLACEAYHT